jgi:hypothetical protein
LEERIYQDFEKSILSMLQAKLKHSLYASERSVAKELQALQLVRPV